MSEENTPANGFGQKVDPSTTYASGYREGYLDGQACGYDTGYEKGFDDGENEAKEFESDSGSDSGAGILEFIFLTWVVYLVYSWFTQSGACK